MERAIWMSRDAGIEATAMFVLGTSKETPGSVGRTLDFIRKNTLFPFDFYHLVPYPGTREWEDYNAMGRLEGVDYKSYNHYCEKAVVETADFSFDQRDRAFHEIKRLYMEMERKWYIRKHLRALNPFILCRRPIRDMVAELLFYTILPFKICRWYARKWLSTQPGPSG
jgi:hypothetical protein